MDDDLNIISMEATKKINDLLVKGWEGQSQRTAAIQCVIRDSIEEFWQGRIDAIGIMARK